MDAGKAGEGGQVGRFGRTGGAILIALLALSISRPGAQTRHPITLVELAELQRMFSPQLSPDGTTLAYFLSNSDWKTNRLIFHMFRQPIVGPPQQLPLTACGGIS